MPIRYGSGSNIGICAMPAAGLGWRIGSSAWVEGAAMEFGWYHEFHRQVEGQSDADAFEQGFEQVEAADRWGLDVFWLAEIHQQSRRSVLSAPMNVAGQIAARTKRIKIGTAVHVLPLTHPLRLAEETATVDTLGYPLFVSVRSASLSGLAPDLKAYREAYTAAGHPGHGRVYLRLSMHVGDDDKSALEEGEPSIMAGYKSLITRLEGSPNVRRRAELEEVRTITYEQVLRDKVVVGGPERVTDRLKELEEELGIDGILFELNFGAAIPAEMMMRSLQLLCEEVMPHFK